MSLSKLKPAGTLRFSHYDQVVQAAIDGSGVALGRNPHTTRHLNDGVLVAPFGRKAVLSGGRITYSWRDAPPSDGSSRTSSRGCTTRSDWKLNALRAEIRVNA